MGLRGSLGLHFSGGCCIPTLFSSADCGCVGLFWANSSGQGLESLFQGCAKLLPFAGFVRGKCAIYRHLLGLAICADNRRVQVKMFENAPYLPGGGFETGLFEDRSWLVVATDFDRVLPEREPLFLALCVLYGGRM